MTEPHPVIVVGAGPVGMTAALALRALDLPVTVLEADGEDRSRPGSRAIFLHRESLEHLESVSEGLGWEIAQHGIVWTTKKTYYGEDLVYERTYPPPDPTRLPHSTNLSQVVIEQLLVDAASAPESSSCGSRSSCRRRRRPTGWCSARRQATNGAPYVVGADGAVDRAVVGPHRARRATHPDSFVIVDVAEDEGSPMLPERVFYYEHPAVHGRNVLLVPFAGGIRADLQLRPDDDPEQFNDPKA
jgi:3-(3-hydroxy-phenyl)propionate hydroxylase